MSELVNAHGQINWSNVKGLIIERGIQALFLGSMLAIVVAYAQSRGGLC